MAQKKSSSDSNIPNVKFKRPLNKKGFYTLLLTAILGMFLFVTYYAVQQSQVYKSSAAGGCRGEGGQCGSKNSCCSGLTCKNSQCVQAGGGGGGGGGGTQDCRKEGGQCGSKNSCCSGLTCKNGSCVSSSGGGGGGGGTQDCRKEGGQCGSKNSCCSGLTCKNSECVGDGGGNACKDAGGACRTKANGCEEGETEDSGLACAGPDAENKVCCLSATANPCKDAGGACRTKANGCEEGETEDSGLACTGPNPENKLCCLVGGEVGTVTFAMSLSFQGVTGSTLSAEDTVDVRVKLRGDLLDADMESVVPFTNNNGIWTGEASFDQVRAGEGYSVLVKGPKHLQKKFCDVTAEDDAPGTYRCGEGNITVVVDQTTTLDFSGALLLVGDLPDQDGVVDSYDISLIRNGLCTTDNPDICQDPGLLSQADVNFDGIVDSQDHSLLISSLSVKYDEE